MIDQGKIRAGFVAKCFENSEGVVHIKKFVQFFNLIQAFTVWNMRVKQIIDVVRFAARRNSYVPSIKKMLIKKVNKINHCFSK